eukprot:274292_1
MATNGAQVNLATAISINRTEQKENHNNNRCGPNMQNETSSNDRNGAAPCAPPSTKHEEDCGASPQQIEQSVQCVIMKTSNPSPKGRKRTSSEPDPRLKDALFEEYLYNSTNDEEYKQKVMQHNEERIPPIQRGFSLADMDTENKRFGMKKYEEPPTRERFNLDMFSRVNLLKNIPVKPMHNTRLICYIYDGGKIKGPHTCDEIISMYVYNQIHDDIIYICDSFWGGKGTQCSWFQLDIPPYIPLDKRFDLGPEYLEKNILIKLRFPQLYDGLIINVIKGKIRKIARPLPIPEVPKRKSILSLFVSFLGKVLSLCTLIIIFLHLLPFGLLALVYYGIYIIIICVPYVMCGCGCRFESESQYQLWFFPVYPITFSGFVVPPFMMMWLLLFKLSYYDEIQSWMIAYIVWGTCSFVMVVTYFTLIFAFRYTDRPKQATAKCINTINKALLFIVAVDFGALDIVSILTDDDLYLDHILEGKAMGVVTLFLTIPIASLLPAAVCGFIANYILEEKFELKCRSDITNTNICFNSLGYGCCEVISSHSLRNSYAFMGGLASNILAVWAITRICAYLLANARSDYRVHAKRTK